MEENDKISRLTAEADSLFKRELISYLCNIIMIGILIYYWQWTSCGLWGMIALFLLSGVTLAFMFGVSTRRKEVEKELDRETEKMKEKAADY